MRLLATLLTATLLIACHQEGTDGVAPPTDDEADTDVDQGGDSDTTWADTDTDTDTDVEDTDVVDTDTDVEGHTDTGAFVPVDTAPPLDTAYPVLEVFEPAHGTWLPEGPVQGYGAVHDDDLVSLTVDGDAVTPDTDGSFALAGDGGPGIVILDTEARDAKGHRSTDARAVMIGDELPPAEVLDDALLVRLDEGPGGIDAIEALAQGLVTPDAIGGLIPNPVISMAQQQCVGWPINACWDWYALDLFVDGVTFGDFTVDLDPKAGGNLLATVTVNGLDVAWHADGALIGIGQSFSGHMTADAVIVTLDVTPYVDANGQLQVTVNGSSVDLQNFQAGLPGWITDVAGFFGIDVDQIVVDQIKSQLDGVLRDQLPSILAGALGSLAAPISIDLAGATLDLSIAVSSIAIDEDGISLGLGLGVATTPDAHPDVGSLYVGWHPPSFPGQVGTRVAISMDAVNELLRGAWAGGLLDLDSLLGTGGAPLDLSILVPGAADATLDVQSPLPFVMVPRDAAHGEIQIGDLDLRLVHADQTPIVDAWTSLRAEVSASMANGAISLAATPLQIAVHVESPDLGHHAALGLEDFFELLADQLLPGLLQTVGAFPIPSVAGFGIVDTSITFDGPEHGYLLVSGKLAPAPAPAP